MPNTSNSTALTTPAATNTTCAMSLQASPVMVWVTRKRITISLIAFTSLVVFNLLVLKTRPLNVMDWSYWATDLGLGTLLLGLAIRSWAAGTLIKSSELTQIGPYSIVRNPLYVGSFLMMFGFCVLLRDIPSLCFIVGPMLALYWFQVRREEKDLAVWFSETWPQYIRRVPRFVPRHLGHDLLNGWSLSQWQVNREYQAVIASLIGVAGIVAWYQFCA